MSTKELIKKELVEQSFSCCIQAVKSYGPPLKMYILKQWKRN